MLKKILLSVILTTSVLSSISYALPSDNKNFYSKLNKNKNLTFVAGGIGTPSKLYKKLPNNMILNYFSGVWFDEKNLYDTISILNNCTDEVDIDDMYYPNIPCIKDIKINFTSNTDSNLLKYVSLIYNDQKLLNDIKNAKLLKKGYRFFYIFSKQAVESDYAGKREQFFSPMEQKIYRGKLYDYVLLPYQLTILNKNRDYIKQVEKNWNIDKTLITK